jgi:N-acetylmuramoyl-L-alanine amidase
MKLRDPQFLDRLANAIAEGILKYKKEFERTGGFTNT